MNGQYEVRCGACRNRSPHVIDKICRAGKVIEMKCPGPVRAATTIIYVVSWTKLIPPTTSYNTVPHAPQHYKTPFSVLRLGPHDFSLSILDFLQRFLSISNPLV